MTDPPTDEELSALYEDTHDATNSAKASRRALFTAGARRGRHLGLSEAMRIVAATEVTMGDDTAGRLALDRVYRALRDARHAVTESLRDAPAGEQNMSAGSSGSVDEAAREGASAFDSSTQSGESGGQLPAKPEAACWKCNGTGWISVGMSAFNPSGRIACYCEKPSETAKPEAAGEEPAIVHNLRSLQRAYAEDPSGKANDPLAYGLGWYELDELLAWLDRPAPAAHAWRTSEERRNVVNQLRGLCEEFGDNDWPDDLHLGDAIEKHLAPYLDELSPAPAAKEAAEQKVAALQDTLIAASVGWSRKNDRLTNERDDLKEERDQLRARVAESSGIVARVHDNLNCMQHETNYAEKGFGWCRAELRRALDLLHPPQPTEQRPDPRAAK